MNLQQAITADNVDELYRLLGQQGNLLDCAPDDPFPNTRLHEAADQGKTKVAMEIAILKPSFARKLNRGGHSPIHLALSKKHYHTVRALMTLDPELIRVRGRGGITPLHFVAREKGANEQENVEFVELLDKFLFACKSSIEDLTNQCETAVHVAVKNHNIKAFKVLFGWLKRVYLTEILDWKDQDGNIVLHIAQSEGQLEIVDLINLQQAIAADNVDELYGLLKQAGNQNLLDCAPDGPFPNTPLHNVVEQGKTEVAMEIAILKPSFTRMLNREGDSPMHLALKKKHYHTVRALMTLDPELIRVRGRGGITPLHFLAGEKGQNQQENVELLELLAEFLYACTSSIEDLTSQCETAVHVAIKNHNTEAFKVLFGWLKRFYLTEILDWKNEDGNTVLHIAVLKSQPEIINLLSGYVKVDARNLEDKTALEIFRENPSGNQDLAQKLRAPILSHNHSLSEYLRMHLTHREVLASIFHIRDESVRNIILVLAALIATATYQAMLTPPGGYWQDDSSNLPADSTVVTAGKPHRAGNIILSGLYLYAFTALNSLVFTVSIGTICILAVHLLPHTFLVYSLSAYVSFAYFATLMIEFSRSDMVAGIVITVCVFSWLLIPLVGQIIEWLRDHRYLRGIDAPRRRVGHFRILRHGE